jgi:hypothetical protein
VDADPDVEALVPVRFPHLRAEVLAEGEQGQAAAHGPLRIVFACLVGAEGGQDAVAGVLQTLPPCASTTIAARDKASSITALIASGSRRCASEVEPTTSRTGC